MLELKTARLDLIPCPLHIAKAIVSNKASLPVMLGANVPDGWPADDVLSFLPFYMENLEKEPETIGWGVWLLIDRRLKTVIGDAGFHGKVDERGSAEIGYAVHSEYRNLGYATEAVRSLIDWAFQSNERIKEIRAECAVNNASSIKFLKKAERTCVAEEGEVLIWKLAKPKAG
jgi:ribosomal-protein-alanine N-acetyltransferase